jgi:hypothetical protein
MTGDVTICPERWTLGYNHPPLQLGCRPKRHSSNRSLSHNQYEFCGPFGAGHNRGRCLYRWNSSIVIPEPQTCRLWKMAPYVGTAAVRFASRAARTGVLSLVR